MLAEAKEEHFEEAQRIKGQIFALEHIRDVSLIDDGFVKDSRHIQEYRIEAYDVAHTSGKNVVGVMTVVESGEIKKSDYRKFIIKDSPANNDTKSLREVVERRLAHPEWPLPRLMVADGGKAQKSAIESVLRKYGIEIPVVAIVKDEYHRPKNMLGVTQYEKDVLLANAEAHRFAISFHRKKRDLIK
jgi:excinuclease ABC subunit C